MALAKNTTIESVDPWTAALDEAMTVGAIGDLTDAYTASLALQLAPSEAVAITTGSPIRIEVCYSTGGIWTPYLEFTSQVFTPSTDTLDTGGVTAGDSDLTVVTGGGTFGVGEYVIIYDDDVDIINSEVVLLKGEAVADTFELKDLIAVNHAATTPLFEMKDQWLIKLPDEANRVRVIINNLLGGCNMVFKSHILKTTSL